MSKTINLKKHFTFEKQDFSILFDANFQILVGDELFLSLVDKRYHLYDSVNNSFRTLSAKLKDLLEVIV